LLFVKKSIKKTKAYTSEEEITGWVMSEKLENGIVFKLGTGFTDQHRKNPPSIGTIVTFKYYGFTKNGIPKFASFLRVRIAR